MKSRFGEVMVLVAGMAFLATPAFAGTQKKPKPPLCDVGTFAVQGAPLGTPEAQIATEIVVGGGQITLGGLCPATAAKLKATKKGTRAKANAQGCQGFRKKAKLKALITDGCRTMTGTLSGKSADKKTRLKQDFTATLVGTTTTLPPGASTTTTTLPPASFLRWTTHAPASVLPGQMFPLALEVNTNGRTCSGEAARVQGTIVGSFVTCRADDCIDDPFTVTQPFFQGPPQIFPFDVRRADGCSSTLRYSFSPEVYLPDPQGNFTIGPFYGEPTVTEVPPPSSRSLSEGCGDFSGYPYDDDDGDPTLYFAVLTGQNPVAKSVAFQSGCGEEFPWTASVDVPWARVDRAAGTSSYACDAVTVTVDPALLPAGQEAHYGTLTVASAGAVGSPLTFPIEVTALTASVQVTQPLPATLPVGQTAPFGIAVAGSFQDVSGSLTLCPADDPSYCDEFLLEATPPSFFGPPGPFAFSIRRSEDCIAAGDYTLAASLYFDNDSFGPFLVPLANVTLPASPPTELLTDEQQLTFAALAGQTPPSQNAFLYTDCGAVGWTASADRPWIQVTPTSASPTDADVATVSVNPNGLAASTTPYTGTVTFTPTDASIPPVAVSVTFHLRNDPTMQWTQLPPATVAPGQQFALSLAVQASTPTVSGEVFSCQVGVPPEDCASEGPFYYESSFQGPPGTFNFTVQRDDDCETGTSYYFVARVFAEQGFDELGPFLGPPTAATVFGAPTGVSLFAFPEELEFHGYGRANPPAQRIAIGEVCDAALRPTITANEPWLRIVDTAGGVLVEADVSSLDAAQGPFQATITVSAPNAAPVTVPVRLNLAC